MKTASIDYALAFALAAIACTVSIVHPAFAQVAAGGGAQAFTTWVTSPAGLGGLIGLFIALVGLVMMMGRHTWEGLGFAVCGGVIFGASATIGGFFGGG